jgi:ribosomal RNA-processing protein 12
LFKKVEQLTTDPSKTTSSKSSNKAVMLEDDVESQAQRVQAVTQAIGALAKHVPSETLHGLFQKLLHRLLLSIQQLQERLEQQKGSSKKKKYKKRTEDDNAMDEDEETTGAADASTQTEEEALVSRICTLLRLAQALVSSEALEGSSIDLLYRAMKPLIRADLGATSGSNSGGNKAQKQAYKTLADICAHYPKHVLHAQQEDMMQLLTSSGSLMACHVSARQMRLKCLLSLLTSSSSQANNSDSVNDPSSGSKAILLPESLLGEVLLCLKDGNAKAREAAYELLLAMARQHLNNKSDKSGVTGSLKPFVTQIVGALGAQTHHMRSAAVRALGRITFEFARHNDELRCELLPHVLPTVLLLLDDHKSREVVKSVVGFVRVSVAAMSSSSGGTSDDGEDLLKPLVGDIVEGLFKYGKGKDRFCAKIKIILKKLVKLFGYQAITPHIPAPDTRLLTHMRKLSEPTARRKAEARADRDLNNEDGDDFGDLMDSDEDLLNDVSRAVQTRCG